MDSANSHNHNYNLRSINNHTVIDMLQPTDLTNNIPSTSSISSTSAHDLNHSHTSSQQADLAHTSTLPSIRQPIIIHHLPQLTFDPDNVNVFFHTFDAHYFNTHFTDEQLYFELIKCLSPNQFYRVSLELDQSIHSFRILKKALIEAYSTPLQTRLNRLRDSPPMGDRTPTQLLCDLKRIMGTCNPHDETITWFLKTKFLNRLPANVKSILAAFDSHPLEEIAKIGDSIIFSSMATLRDTNCGSLMFC